VPSHCFINDILLDLHAQTHQTIDESDDKGSKDALKEDAVEAANTVDPRTDDGEDIDMEGKVDLCKGIISDWDILAKDFIMKAQECGKFEHSLLHTLHLTSIFVYRQVFYLRP
jgi:hypothetical protein